MHGGRMGRTHWGSAMRRKISLRRKASDWAASHCAVGMDWMAPRKISATLALVGRARPSTTLTQSGNGKVQPTSFSSNGNTGGEVDEHQDGRIAKQLHVPAHARAHGRRGRQRQG